jgi:hypothetical protein
MDNISRDMAMPRDNSPSLTGLPAVQASVTTMIGKKLDYCIKKATMYTECCRKKKSLYNNVIIFICTPTGLEFNIGGVLGLCEVMVSVGLR